MNEDNTVACKICHRSIIYGRFLGHIKREHPKQYGEWIESRGDFGMSVWEHFSPKLIGEAMIRG